jgi:4-hydroxybenzoate polyprenyltransferase
MRVPAHQYSTGSIGTRLSNYHPWSHQASQIRRLSARLLFEIIMAWKITARDFPATLIPYLCVGVGTFLAAALPMRELPTILLKLAVYGFLYVYAFTTVNQLTSIEEDRVNKPDRPLPQGLITRRWMFQHAIVTNILYAASGFLFAIPWPTLTWLALIHLHNIRWIYRHWFFKNIVFIGLGAAVQLTATWELISPAASPPWSWICVASLLAGIGYNVQDIRDVAGDRLVGRKTMPIAWGEKKARIALSFVLFAIPMVQYMALRSPRPGSGLVLLAAIGIPGAVVWLSAICFLLFQNPRSDNWSYQLFCFWWCSSLLLQPLAVAGQIA